MDAVNTWMLERYIHITSAITDAFKREEGQDFAEYALIFALVVLAAFAAFGILGGKINDAVTAVANAFP